MPDLDQRKSDGAVSQPANDGGLAPAVGTTTLVDGANVGAPGAAAATPPGVRPPTPPEFAAMDADLIEKLWASRAALGARRAAFRGRPDDQFWDAVRAIGAADLHTLQVVTHGAKSVGVWPTMQTITGWYTFAASYAIEFLGSPAGIPAGGAWGKDFPQVMVRREHENTAHTWYRHNSGAGNPGMHLGVDDGAGYHNIHWDPTNPMDHVGNGGLHLTQMGPYVEPKGMAIYAPWALAMHAAEIGKFGEGLRNLAKKPDTPTEKFLRISSGKESADKGNEFADRESADPGKIDLIASQAAVARVRRAASAILAIHTSAQSLAMTDDAAAQPLLDATLTKLEAAEATLWEALAAFIVFLKGEAGVTTETAFDTPAKWAAAATWTAYDTIVKLHTARLAKRAAN